MDFRSTGRKEGATGAVGDIVDKYKGASESELIGEISAKIGEAKRNGTYNAADFDRFYNTVAPFLNAEQLDRLKAVLKEVNG